MMLRDQTWWAYARQCLPCCATAPAQGRNLLLSLFGGHTQQCSGLLLSLHSLTNHSWRSMKPHELTGIEPRSATCKASTLPTELSFWPPVHAFDTGCQASPCHLHFTVLPTPNYQPTCQLASPIRSVVPWKTESRTLSLDVLFPPTQNPI